jgi:oligopeptide/dipeptide ABC transporter ATP-binding protein
MYAGEVVETGPRGMVFERPAHPYTQGLLAALDLEGDRMHSIPGQVPDLRVPISGCPFLSRCPKAHDGCADQRPELIRLSETREVRCTLYEPGDHVAEIAWSKTAS